MLGVLFVCQAHAHDAVGEGKRLVVAPAGAVVGGDWSDDSPGRGYWKAVLAGDGADAEPCESRSDFAVDDDEPRRAWGVKQAGRMDHNGQ